MLDKMGKPKARCITCEALEMENAELNILFEMHLDRDKEAIEMWRKETGESLKRPTYRNLLSFLLQKNSEMGGEIEKLRVMLDQQSRAARD